MILASLIANLLTISNLTEFLDRLITDGEYKTVQLTFDDAIVDGHDFVFKMVKLAVGKYTTVIKRANYDPVDRSTNPQTQRSVLLPVIKVNYVEGGERRFFNLLVRTVFYENAFQHVVLLVPMQSEDRKIDLWYRIGRWGSYLYRIKTIVVFYEVAVDTPIEIYALNYKMIKTGHFQVDVEKFLFQGQPNETNLHEKIFGAISLKLQLRITTNTAGVLLVTKPPIDRGNKGVINLGDAGYYFSNFIARNSHFVDVSIEQKLNYQYFALINGKISASAHVRTCNGSECNPPTEKVYNELYNAFPARLSTRGQ